MVKHFLLSSPIEVLLLMMMMMISGISKLNINMKGREDNPIGLGGVTQLPSNGAQPWLDGS